MMDQAPVPNVVPSMPEFPPQDMPQPNWQVITESLHNLAQELPIFPILCVKISVYTTDGITVSPCKAPAQQLQTISNHLTQMTVALNGQGIQLMNLSNMVANISHVVTDLSNRYVSHISYFRPAL